MKKSWLLLFLMVLMCGCSNQSKEETGVEASVEQEAASKLAQEKQLVDRQLYEKLSEAVETIGYTYDMQTFAENEYNQGVLYSELIDFDNDGVQEVYAFMKGVDYPLSAYTHRNKDNYIQEVWTGNANGESAILSFSSEVDQLVCSACDMNVSLVKGQDGRTFIKMFSNQTSQGTTVDKIWIYAKEPSNSAMELVITGYTIDNNNAVGIDYFLDGEVTDQATYDTAFAPYTGEERSILISNFSEKKYGFDYTSPASNVGTVLAALLPSVNSIVGQEALLEKKKREEIIGALGEFNTVRRIHHQDKRVVQSLVLDVIQKANLDHEYSDMSEMVFDGASVKAKYKETFGVDLDIEKMNFPSRDSQSIMSYEAGKFYIYPTGFYFDAIDRHFQDVYKVRDDLYYVTILDNEFNHTEYSLSKDTNITSEEMFAQDFASWPKEARIWLKPGIQRYAVVKYMDGVPKVQYFGAQNLTDQQIEAF